MRATPILVAHHPLGTDDVGKDVPLVVGEPDGAEGSFIAEAGDLSIIAPPERRVVGVWRHGDEVVPHLGVTGGLDTCLHVVIVTFRVGDEAFAQSGRCLNDLRRPVAAHGPRYVGLGTAHLGCNKGQCPVDGHASSREIQTIRQQHVFDAPILHPASVSGSQSRLPSRALTRRLRTLLRAETRHWRRRRIDVVHCRVGPR